MQQAGWTKGKQDIRFRTDGGRGPKGNQLTKETTDKVTAGGFAAERGLLQQISINSWYARNPHSASNAGSVLLRAEG